MTFRARACLYGLPLLFCLSTLPAADRGQATPVPDLTNGDAIPAGATHDWNLGATGARGWMFSEKLTTTAARQIQITKVEPQSPAAEVLEVGDVILGVGGSCSMPTPEPNWDRR
ncbi:MAG: DUF6288 domain-containing protein [Planctomycetaceae bacterium]